MKRWLLTLLLCVVLSAMVFGAYLYSFAQSPLQLSDTPKQITIAQGSSIRSIANTLSAEGVIPDAWRFVLIAKLIGRSDDLKAGVYQLDSDMTPIALIEKLASGETSMTVIRVIEGWTLRQAISAVRSNPDLKQDIETEKDVANALNLSADKKLEGLIFPDTYQLAKGSSSSTFFKLAYRKMEKVLESEWSQRAASVSLQTPYDALILASIIEKETGAEKDRALISAVFHNRLKIGMRLQTDPTVIYGVGPGFDGNLTKKQLQTDTPYNSYTRMGLPPTPISLPGKAAINAALHPAESKAIYFVAKGDGSSIFSETLQQHNQAVSKYQR